MNRTTLTLATLLLAAGPATTYADLTPGSYWVNEQFFEYGITHLPDFDQRRLSLPGSGDFYCVPTATMNMLAYAADHGLPALEPSSAFPWQSPANYIYIGNEIEELGTKMGTIANVGTGGGGWYDGTREWLDDYGYLGHLTVTHYYAGSQFAPSPSQLAQMGAGGKLVSIAYGFYVVNGNYEGHPLIERDGGHAVTFSGCIATGFSPTTIAVRDPADDSNYSAQSMFGDRMHALDHHVVANCAAPECVGTMWSLDDDGSGTMLLIDEYTAISPPVSWSFQPTNNLVTTVCPYQLEGFPAMPGQITLPGTSITDVAMHPDLVDFMILSDGDLIRYRTLAGLSEPVTSVPGATRMVYGRNRALYTYADGQLICLDLDGDTPSSRIVFPGIDVDELAFDDMRDEVVLLSIGDGRIARYGSDLGFVADAPLPAWVELAGDGVLALHPDGGRAYFGSETNDRVYVADSTAGGFPVFTEFLVDVTGPPTGMCFDDRGHLFISGPDDVREFMEVGPDDWQLVPDSAFAGAPGGERFAMTRSRTNFDPKTHTGPNWRHRHPSDLPLGVFVADCREDIVPNGAVDIDDIVAVVLDHGSGVPNHGGDVNDDGLVTIDDIVLVVLAWGPCD